MSADVIGEVKGWQGGVALGILSIISPD